MEMDEYERILKNDIMENECPYNQRTDDPIDENQDLDFEYEPSKFELDLEDALQEMVDKIAESKENFKKIQKIISENLNLLTHKQLITIYLYYYLELSEQEIGDYFGVSRQRIHAQIDRISKKLFKNA